MNLYTETEKDFIFRAWDDGLAASAIAEKFGRDADGKLIRTRSSILGLVHRKHPDHARSPRARSTRRKTECLPPLATRPIPTQPPLLANSTPRTAESATVADGVGGVRLADLGNLDCRWPIGTVPGEDGPRFCGCPQFRGIVGHASFGRSSYCLEHYRQNINHHYRAAFEKALEQDNRARRRPMK